MYRNGLEFNSEKQLEAKEVIENLDGFMQAFFSAPVKEGNIKCYTPLSI